MEVGLRYYGILGFGIQLLIFCVCLVSHSINHFLCFHEGFEWGSPLRMRPFLNLDWGLDASIFGGEVLARE